MEGASVAQWLAHWPLTSVVAGGGLSSPVVSTLASHLCGGWRRLSATVVNTLAFHLCGGWRGPQ